MRQLLRSRTRLLDSIEDRSRDEAVRLGGPTAARDEPYLLWLGVLLAVVLVVGFVLFASSGGRSPTSVALAAPGVEGSRELTPAPAGRTSCEAIGSSDLRVPTEGVWFQSNCVPILEGPLVASTTSCNRTSLTAGEFTAVSDGLYVYRRAPAATAYLWYASSEACFDLVSARVVTAVCVDQAVSFAWDARSACSRHGGVLAWVNGR